jgi:hypothetical protein
MSRFEQLTRRVDDCRDAAIRCDNNGKLEMSGFWFSVANALEHQILDMTVAQAQEVVC